MCDVPSCGKSFLVHAAAKLCHELNCGGVLRKPGVTKLYKSEIAEQEKSAIPAAAAAASAPQQHWQQIPAGDPAAIAAAAAGIKRKAEEITTQIDL